MPACGRAGEAGDFWDAIVPGLFSAGIAIGFIRPHHSANGQRGADTFFHHSALLAMDFDETLLERTVSFEPADDPRGPRARRVWPADTDPAPVGKGW